jgi:tRNA threonylcarbamoyladenosine biosynthesis protein TsaE
VHIEHVTNAEEETVALGEALGRVMRAGDILALDGALGAGKTRLVRGVVAGLGGEASDVSSPTFVFMNEYDTPAGPLVHVDAYRLEGPEGLDSIGWDAAMSGGAMVVIEWAERIAAALAPGTTAHVRLEHAGAERRRVTIELPREWTQRPALGALLDLTRARLPREWTRCPTTGRAVYARAPTFPFVDEHARMADLGKWFSGSYSVSRELSEGDLGEGGER